MLNLDTRICKCKDGREACDGGGDPRCIALYLQSLLHLGLSPSGSCHLDRPRHPPPVIRITIVSPSWAGRHSDIIHPVRSLSVLEIESTLGTVLRKYEFTAML